MFWDKGYTPSQNIEALLEKENVKVEEFLDDEDILQECKSQKKSIINYFTRPDVIKRLIELITREPANDLPFATRFRHANMACEILTLGLPSLDEKILSDADILKTLYSYLENEPPLNPLLSSFFSKTFSMLFTKKTEQDWFLYQQMCLQFLEYIKSQNNFIDLICKHFLTPIIPGLIMEMIREIEGGQLKRNLYEWLTEEKLVARLITILGNSNESDKHTFVAEFLCDLIYQGRTMRQADQENDSFEPVFEGSNPILKIIESEITIKSLLDVILEPNAVESSIISGISVVLMLIKPVVFIEEAESDRMKFIQGRERKIHDEILNTVIKTIAPRLKDFNELMRNPPTKTCILVNTAPNVKIPFGSTRLHVCRLFTVLLQTRNEDIAKAICETDFLQTLLNLFKEYCWNNFLHTEMEKCVQSIFYVPPVVLNNFDNVKNMHNKNIKNIKHNNNNNNNNNNDLNLARGDSAFYALFNNAAATITNNNNNNIDNNNKNGMEKIDENNCHDIDEMSLDAAAASSSSTCTSIDDNVANNNNNNNNDADDIKNVIEQKEEEEIKIVNGLINDNQTIDKDQDAASILKEKEEDNAKENLNIIANNNNNNQIDDEIHIHNNINNNNDNDLEDKDSSVTLTPEMMQISNDSNSPSLLQIHAIVNCKIISKLIDCWEYNKKSESSENGRRLGYMGHLIKIFKHIKNCIAEYENIGALIENNLSEDDMAQIDLWHEFMKPEVGELATTLATQSHMLANCNAFEAGEMRNSLTKDFLTDSQSTWEYIMSSNMINSLVAYGDSGNDFDRILDDDNHDDDGDGEEGASANSNNNNDCLSLFSSKSLTFSNPWENPFGSLSQPSTSNCHANSIINSGWPNDFENSSMDNFADFDSHFCGFASALDTSLEAAMQDQNTNNSKMDDDDNDDNNDDDDDGFMKSTTTTTNDLQQDTFSFSKDSMFNDDKRMVASPEKSGVVSHEHDDDRLLGKSRNAGVIGDRLHAGVSNNMDTDGSPLSLTRTNQVNVNDNDDDDDYDIDDDEGMWTRNLSSGGSADNDNATVDASDLFHLANGPITTTSDEKTTTAIDENGQDASMDFSGKLELQQQQQQLLPLQQNKCNNDETTTTVTSEEETTTNLTIAKAENIIEHNATTTTTVEVNASNDNNEVTTTTTETNAEV